MNCSSEAHRLISDSRCLTDHISAFTHLMSHFVLVWADLSQREMLPEVDHNILRNPDIAKSCTATTTRRTASGHRCSAFFPCC